MPFLGHEMTPALRATVAKRGEKQRKYESEHKYDLEKFGLTEEQIRRDCAFFYDTFLPAAAAVPKTGTRVDGERRYRGGGPYSESRILGVAERRVRLEGRDHLGLPVVTSVI